MNNVNPKKIEKLWFVTTKEQIETINSNGVFTSMRNCIMIHKTKFGIHGKYSDDKVSILDYFAAYHLPLDKDLEYIVFELDPKLLIGKLKTQNTSGEVMSECAFIYTGGNLDPSSIINISKKKLNLMDLFYFNSVRLRSAMFTYAKTGNSIEGLDKKSRYTNNRIIDEKHEVLSFNEILITRYGNHKIFAKGFSRGVIEEFS